MKKIIVLTLLLFSISGFAQTATASAAKKPEKKGEYIRGLYIPKDLDDCLVQFSTSWSDSMKNAFKKVPENLLLQKYSTLHEWLMNNWGLWEDSRLSKYFYEFGMYHPEDMAGMILISYHREVNKEELKVSEQIEHYRDYWKVKERSRPDIVPDKVQSSR